MFKKLVLTTTILLFAVAAATVAQQIKVGYMNPQEVLDQLPETTEIEQELNTLVQQKREELKTRSGEFQQALANYRQDSASMSEEQKSKREEELAGHEQELIQFQQTIQQQIQQRRAELMAPVYDRMDRAISAIAENMDLDFVLNETTGFGETIIFYASDQKLNITQQVLEHMNNN